GAEREARARRRSRLAPMLAGEKPPGQGVVGNHRETFGRAQRQQLALDLPEEKVVAWLHGLAAGEAQHVAAAPRARRLPGRIVGAADVAGLAGAHDVVERAQRLLDRGLGGRMMRRVEVDAVGPTPPERSVDGVQDVLARQAPAPRAAAGRAGALRGHTALT